MKVAVDYISFPFEVEYPLHGSLTVDYNYGGGVGDDGSGIGNDGGGGVGEDRGGVGDNGGGGVGDCGGKVGGGDLGDGVDKCGWVGHNGVMGDNWVDCLSCQGQCFLFSVELNTWLV